MNNGHIILLSIFLSSGVLRHRIGRILSLFFARVLPYHLIIKELTQGGLYPVARLEPLRGGSIKIQKSAESIVVHPASNGIDLKISCCCMVLQVFLGAVLVDDVCVGV